MEELTATVKQNTEQVRQANQLAMIASSIAAKDGDVVAHVVATMGSINLSARKIVDISSVINGISIRPSPKWTR